MNESVVNAEKTKENAVSKRTNCFVVLYDADRVQVPIKI